MLASMFFAVWLFATSNAQTTKHTKLDDVDNPMTVRAAQRVVIQHPSAHKPFLGTISEFSTEMHGLNVDDPTPIVSGHILFHSSDPLGCSAWPSFGLLGPFASDSSPLNIGIVDRGACTFVEKTKLAQDAGLDALIVVSADGEEPTPMSADATELQILKASSDNGRVILALMASSDLKQWILENPMLQFQPLSIQRYAPKIYDPSMLVMVLVSTLLVGVGAWYSSDAERAKMYGNDSLSVSALRQTAVVQELDATAAWSFVITASIGLLTLYFFASYLFPVILFVFGMGATNGLSTIFAHCVDAMAPNLQKTRFTVKVLDNAEWTLSDVLGFVPALCVSISWLMFRLSDVGWILQNVLCVGLLLSLQRTLKVPTMKIAAILLWTAFLYDVFWVFLSPMFFEASPMIRVATYQHSADARDTLPVVLKFPRIDDAFHHSMVLGLGDIALPGLFLSYLLRFDYLCAVSIKDSFAKGYFVPALIGYAVGMALTDINLVLMRSGQPALLFLVPCTVGLTAVLARYRGREHLKRVWNAQPKKCAKATKSGDLILNHAAFKTWNGSEL